MGFIKRASKRTDLQQLKQLQQLQQLEQLEQLERLERLEISNCSFENVNIITPPEKTVIYLDPPYKGTAKYQIDISHDTLKEYIDNSKYPIYMSGYESDMVEVLSINHRTTLSNKNPVIEKLFVNEIAMNTAVIHSNNPLDVGSLDF